MNYRLLSFVLILSASLHTSQSFTVGSETPAEYIRTLAARRTTRTLLQRARRRRARQRREKAYQREEERIRKRRTETERLEKIAAKARAQQAKIQALLLPKTKQDKIIDQAIELAARILTQRKIERAREAVERQPRKQRNLIARAELSREDL